MRFQSRRSANGILGGLVFVLIVLLILGIVTQMIVFYILFGVILGLSILGIIGLFSILRKTAATTTSTRRSTYDITEGKDYTSKESPVIKSEDFCPECGMKLESGTNACANCGKKL